MKIPNRGYDKETFIVSLQQNEIALLPNLGKFCKAGCGKRIEGKVVKRKIGNKITIYFRKAQKNKEFCTTNCKVKFFNKNTSRKLRPSLSALIGLKVLNDKTPYRELTVYLKNNSKLHLKITPEYKELWNVLEKICKYRFMNLQNPLETSIPVLLG